jgi:hypothetical protein
LDERSAQDKTVVINDLGYTLEELRPTDGTVIGDLSTWRSWRIRFDDALEIVNILDGNLNVFEAVLLEPDQELFIGEDGIYDLQKALKAAGCK